MKKVLGLLLFLIIVLVGVGYWAVFTPSGNSFLQPFVQQFLNQKLPVKAKLEEFRISPLAIKLYVGKDTLIQASGKLDPFKQNFDIHYDLNIAKLEELEPLINQKLRGSLKTKGSVKGDKKKIDIIGKADVVDGKIDYHAVLQNMQPKSLQATITGAKLQKILYMIYQPHFADANINAKIHLTSLDPKALAGDITAKVTQGRTDKAVLTKEFGIEGADIRFTLDDKSVIKNSVVTSDVTLLSSVAKVYSKGAKFDINSISLDAPYKVVIDDLNKLYFVTKQKMRGSVTATGKIKKDKDLLVTLHSDTLGGKIDAKVLNNKVQADINKIKVVQLTHMLYYPKVFDSSMDAKLRYDLATKKGTLHAQAHDGRILPNEMTFLLKQMANFDITREIYKLTELNSTIDDKTIISQLDMQSRLTHISAKDAKVDLDKELVDAKLRIDIKDMPVFVKIQGKLKDPNIKIDAGKMLKARAKKEVKKQLEKRLKDKLPSQVKGIMNLF